MKTLSLLFACWILPVSAWASTELGTPPTYYSVAKVIVVLSLIIAFIFLAAWLAKRSGLNGLAKRNNFHVAANLALSPKEKLVLVKVGEQHLLLGASPSGIANLHTFPEGVNPLEDASCDVSNTPHTIDKEKAQPESTRDFASQIKHVLMQGHAKQ